VEKPVEASISQAIPLVLQEDTSATCGNSTKKTLIRKSRKAATGGNKYTVEDQPASRHTWQFRVRESGGKRRIVYRIFVRESERKLIRELDYEGFKAGLIEDFKATTRGSD
jgi:hypothetical protein